MNLVKSVKLYFKSVDGILADFHDKIDSLNELKDHYYSKGLELHQQISELQEETDGYFAESKYASDVAARITKLVGKV